MDKKKRPAVPPFGRPDEAPVGQSRSADTARQPTSHARPVGEVLEGLQTQMLDAVSDPFFDKGATTAMTPVTKRMRSETGAVEVHAKRRDPAIEATVTIDVRCDQDQVGDAGRYQLRAVGHVTRETVDGHVDSEFPVSIEVRQDNGALTLGSDEVRGKIADAIRSTGTSHEV